MSLSKLLLTCLELDTNRTLKYLDIDSVSLSFITHKDSIFDRRSSHRLKWQLYGYDYALNDVRKYPNHISNHRNLKKVLGMLSSWHQSGVNE